MRKKTIAFLGSIFIAAAPPLAAHPHVFVDIALRLEVDAQGLVQAVEVSWTYDEFESLLVLDDLQLDTDYDGQLTEAEAAALQGFDLKWVEGFQGDLFLNRAGAPVMLDAPQAGVAELQGGRITSRHRRALTTPVAADGLVLQAYDPTYYTAYTLVGAEAGTGCRALVTPPDLNAAYALVEEMLFATPQDQVEEAYPEVGKSFADTLELSCGRV